MKLFPTFKDQEEEPSRKRRVPQDAEEWCAEGLKAEENSDWTRAIVCYRRAMAAAPFCTRARQLLEEAVEQQILENGIPQREMRRTYRLLASIDEGDEAAEPERAIGLADLYALAEQGSALEEDEDEEASETAGKAAGLLRPEKKALPRPRVALHSFSKSRRWRTAAAVTLAVGITGGMLFGVAAATSYVRSVMTQQSLSSLTASEPDLPPEVESKTAEATRLIQEGEPQQAAELLRDAVDQYPEHSDTLEAALVQALRAHGNAELRERRYASASEAFREATETAPAETNNWIDLGQALRNQARSLSATSRDSRELLIEAESSFKKALALKSENTSALLGLAQVYAARNERREAVETYERLVAVAPSTFEGRMAQTALQQLRGR